jgi:hypothetical protein
VDAGEGAEPGVVHLGRGGEVEQDARGPRAAPAIRANPAPPPGRRGGRIPAEYVEGMRPLTRTAVSATAHCLTGCAIGEVLGLAIGTALGWGDGPTIALAVALAFVFGYALTMLPLVRSGLTLSGAIGVALAADTVSIAIMEAVDNAIMVAIPGAMDAGLSEPRFWWALALALAVAFVAALPVNLALISRGRGHAVAHSHHGARHP